MPYVQIVVAYLPMLIMAVCVIFLFRRTGQGRNGVILGALPLVVIFFSMLASMMGELRLTTGLQGQWMLAGMLAVLAFGRWPRERGGAD